MSFGNKLGRGIGILGALAVEGAVRGATGLGQFGADVVDGAQAGYDEKHAALLVTREANRIAALKRNEERKAAHLAAMQAAPMAIAVEPAPAKAKARG